MEKKERKERKEKEKDIEHIPSFSIPYRKRKRISCAQMAAPPPPPSLPAFVRVAQKLLQLFFIAKLAPLPVFFHPFFVDPFLSLSYIPPLPSLTRDYRGREKLVGGDWISFLRATSACDYRDSGNCPTSRLLFFRLHVWGSWFFSLSLLLRDSWINRSRLVEQIEFVFFPRVLMQRSFDIGTCFWILFIRCKGNG